MPFTYEYPRPAVTVDSVVFTIKNGELAVLLIKRAGSTFRGYWALPGGFVNESESLEHAALRELHEETGLTGLRLEQLGAFGNPGRDPRGHTISIAFIAFTVSAGRPASKIRAGDDASAVDWHPISAFNADRRAPKLAFDHVLILGRALARLREEASRLGANTAVDFAPPRFTLGELQHVYEAVVGHSVDKRNFRAKLISQKVVEAVLAERRTGRHRPAQLYRFVGAAEDANETPSPAPRKAKIKSKSKPKSGTLTKRVR